MASYNGVVLLGNLTRDPELRYIPSGTAVADIGLAVNNSVKRDDQWVEEPTFVEITLWGRTAEIANEYLSKGSPVLIEGHLKLDTWEKDGQKRSKLKVVGEKLQLIGSRDGSSGGGPDRSQSHETTPHEPTPEYSSTSGGPSMPPNDEIPF